MNCKKPGLIPAKLPSVHKTLLPPGLQGSYLLAVVTFQEARCSQQRRLSSRGCWCQEDTKFVTDNATFCQRSPKIDKKFYIIIDFFVELRPAPQHSPGGHTQS